MPKSYWEARRLLIASEIAHLDLLRARAGQRPGDPWMLRLRATKAVDADFRTVLDDFRAAWPLISEVRA